MAHLRTIEESDAYEIVVGGDGSSPFLLTCEHASVRLPEPWAWPDEDRWLVGDHWSWDPGAADVCRELASALGAPAVLARFSRLLCDPNRAEGDPQLFRDIADGKPVRFNLELGADERERRLARYHRPYHRAIDRVAAAHPGRVVFSVHTFTPVYEGQPRDVEIGVLFDAEDELGHGLARGLDTRGLPARLNEPYSGKAGLIYSAARAASAHGRRALEIEVRNDLATDPAWRARALPQLADALTALLPSD